MIQFVDFKKTTEAVDSATSEDNKDDISSGDKKEK